MELQNQIRTIEDLFKLLESMKFFAGDLSLNEADAYLIIKKHFSDHMSDPVSSLEASGIEAREINKVTGDQTHFQKRDLNEAEEY